MDDQITEKEPIAKDVKDSRKRPKRYNLYDQMNINEKYLDYFIVGTIFLLIILVIIGVL